MNRLFIYLLLLMFPLLSFGQNEVDDKQVYITVETQAEFNGGKNKMFECIGKNFKISQEVHKMNISCGRFLISFIVEKDGSLSDIKIDKGCWGSLDKELINVISAMPKWKPAIHQQKVVRSRFTFPFIICFE